MLFRLLRELLNLPPGNSSFNKDINTLRSLLQKSQVEVIPWGKEEAELLSLNNQNIKIKGSRSQGLGVLKTIYHEALVHYAYKIYRRQKDYRLILAHTSNREYVYICLPNISRMYLNEKAIGIIRQNGECYTPNGKHMMGRIEKSHGQYNLVELGGSDVAQIINPDVPQSNNPRALILLENISDQAMDLFLGLVLHECIHKIRKI